MSKQEIKEWYAANGYKNYRLNYDLDENSIVFDLGGYQGQYTFDIYEKYKSNVYVFEPAKAFYLDIKSRFDGNEKIKVFNYGVAGKTETLNLVNSADSSYVFESRSSDLSSAHSYEKVEIKSFFDMYQETGVNVIDLIKINIEGGEYDLMKNIFETGLTTKIKNYQIQFHNVLNNSEQLMYEIREELSKTHKMDWKYEWVWENWSILE